TALLSGYSLNRKHEDALSVFPEISLECSADNVSSTLGVARWALPHPTKRNVFKDLTLALNGAKQQFLKRRARGE
ncbi:unnamed protein product, partial [Brassica rapa]